MLKIFVVPLTHLSLCLIIDLVFIIDSSGSIQDAGSGNWNLILDFVVKFIESYNIGENNVRVGLTKFSNSGSVEIHLDDYYDKSDLTNAVRAVSLVGGTSNTADGLQVARENVFVESRGDRPDVPNYAVVITDGNANEREDETDDEASALQNKAKVLVLGITNKVSAATLETIATNSDSIFTADFFDVLLDELSPMVTAACPTDTQTPAPTSASTPVPASTVASTAPTEPSPSMLPTTCIAMKPFPGFPEYKILYCHY